MKIKYEGTTPYKKYDYDAGYDLLLNEDIVLSPGRVVTTELDFSIEIPKGYMGILLPRGGSAKRGILVQTPPIDHGYTGKIHAIIFYAGVLPMELHKGDRVCQLVIIPIMLPQLVEETSDFFRGDNRFNSTGTRGGIDELQ